ncbi:MAG TPA: ACP S-malonyltransferase, partial [Pseudomonadales bacterium]|nr:ACP S-malonyltransferase [Pseudomonadales bacterium]
ALKAVGGRVMPLAVSAPFHCELMRPAAEKMQEELAGVTFNQPKISVIQNVNAEYATDPDEIRSNLVEQMYRAVLWTDSVKRLANDGVEILVECGPGKVLSGMIKRISKTLKPLSINSVDSLERAVAELS